MNIRLSSQAELEWYAGEYAMSPRRGRLRCPIVADERRMKPFAGGARHPHRTAQRCRCKRCGAHTPCTIGATISGQCGTCGGYDLLPVVVASAQLMTRP
jgi:hypothetical protein